MRNSHLSQLLTLKKNLKKKEQPSCLTSIRSQRSNNRTRTSSQKMTQQRTLWKLSFRFPSSKSHRHSKLGEITQEVMVDVGSRSQQRLYFQMDSLTSSTGKSAHAERRSREDSQTKMEARSMTHWKNCSRTKIEKQKKEKLLKPSESQRKNARRTGQQ